MARPASNGTPLNPDDEMKYDVGVGLCILHSILGAMVDGAISLEQLKLEAGHLVEQLTQLSTTFRKLQLCLEEYVCLKVVAMLNQGKYIYLKLAIKLKNSLCLMSFRHPATNL